MTTETDPNINAMLAALHAHSHSSAPAQAQAPREQREQREQEARGMQQAQDFSPLLQPALDMQPTYNTAVQHMHHIFCAFFSLDSSAINARNGPDHRGALHDWHLSYLLQEMGLSIYRSSAGTTMEGLGHTHYDKSTKNLPDNNKETSLKWFAKINLFHYHFHPPANFDTPQRVWVYAEP